MGLEGKTLAVADAVLWPAAFAVAAANLSVPTKAFGATLIALAFLVAWRRVHRALGRCKKPKPYRFTTWLIVRCLGVLLVAGLVLKIAMVFTS